MLRYLGGIFWQRDPKICEALLSVEKDAFFKSAQKPVQCSIGSWKACKEKGVGWDKQPFKSIWAT